MSRLLRHFLSLFYRPDRLAVGLFLLYATQVFGDTQGDAEAQFYLWWLYAHAKGVLMFLQKLPTPKSSQFPNAGFFNDISERQ